MFVRKGFNVEIESESSSNDGRIIALKLKIGDYTFQLINIYSPNNSSERKTLYRKPH